MRQTGRYTDRKTGLTERDGEFRSSSKRHQGRLDRVASSLQAQTKEMASRWIWQGRIISLYGRLDGVASSLWSRDRHRQIGQTARGRHRHSQGIQSQTDRMDRTGEAGQTHTHTRTQDRHRTDSARHGVRSDRLHHLVGILMQVRSGTRARASTRRRTVSRRRYTARKGRRLSALLLLSLKLPGPS